MTLGAVSALPISGALFANGFASFGKANAIRGIEMPVSTELQRSFVIILNFLTGPNTVLGVVSRIVITPFDSQFWGRFWPHISKKVLKRVPAITNFDTASAIVFIRGVVGVITSGFHILPAVIFRRWFAAYAKAVSYRHFYDFSRQASAGISLTGAKSRCCGSRYVSADAQALPSNRFSAFIHTPYHCQSPEGLAGKIEMRGSHVDSIAKLIGNNGS